GVGRGGGGGRRVRPGRWIVGERGLVGVGARGHRRQRLHGGGGALHHLRVGAGEHVGQRPELGLPPIEAIPARVALGRGAAGGGAAGRPDRRAVGGGRGP